MNTKTLLETAVKNAQSEGRNVKLVAFSPYEGAPISSLQLSIDNTTFRVKADDATLGEEWLYSEMLLNFLALALPVVAKNVQDAASEMLTEVLGSSKIKTYQAWENSETGIGDFLKPCDEVDEEMYLHFAEAVSPRYDIAGLMQNGEAEYERLGQKHYMTFSCVDERYFYLGILPPFKQPK